MPEDENDEGTDNYVSMDAPQAQQPSVYTALTRAGNTDQQVQAPVTSHDQSGLSAAGDEITSHLFDNENINSSQHMTACRGHDLQNSSLSDEVCVRGEQPVVCHDGNDSESRTNNARGEDNDTYEKDWIPGELPAVCRDVDKSQPLNSLEKKNRSYINVGIGRETPVMLHHHYASTSQSCETKREENQMYANARV